MSGLRASYDAWHAGKGLLEEGTESDLKPWHRTVINRLPDLNHKSVLEVGCGRGSFAIWLAQHFSEASITAVDFSTHALGIAAARAARAKACVRFQVEDAENLRLPANAFDFAISCECLEHVPHPNKMTNEIRRVLKPNGRFVLTTENYFNGMLLAWIVAWWRGEAFDSGSGTQPHENFFLYWRVKKILESSRLRVEHMESNHFQWLLLPLCAPSRFCTEDFTNPALKRLFRPFGRHFTFEGTRV